MCGRPPVVHRTTHIGRGLVVGAPINIRPPARTLRLRELLSPVKALHGHRAPPLSRLRLSARRRGESGEHSYTEYGFRLNFRARDARPWTENAGRAEARARACGINEAVWHDSVPIGLTLWTKLSPLSSHKCTQGDKASHTTRTAGPYGRHATPHSRLS